MNVDVLAIAVHPDDVEQTCGGTLIKMAEMGYRTGTLDLTAGSSGGSGTEITPNLVPPQDLTKPVENNKDIKGVDLQKSNDKSNSEVTERIGRKKNSTDKNAESENLASGIGN